MKVPFRALLYFSQVDEKQVVCGIVSIIWIKSLNSSQEKA